ncbi:class I SAM-dependent methyltransferase [Boudabousia marimammalium]|uniref:site-specific DNA-methyltransferase (adenine-specific) n=1 Tax=Boudabousia marimammalium TaxID=156892 RepID=A0A1Q5PSA6_9ACTO|nr:class I SAM-dependent methyltransferase [Boudabousia marimammalium]OKL50468.1 hypothetical protein BM477_00385 [Boudabousia marimammalium]
MKMAEFETSEKLRGGFYTPWAVANFLATWATTRAESVLEPSSGDGVFLEAMSHLAFGPRKVTAVELDSVEARKSRERLDRLDGQVINMDYLDFDPDTKFDAIVGNPPFIRYQYLSAHSQLKAKNLYASQNLSFTKRTNAWVPFLIKALTELSPGGRLAMVIPAEILNVLHSGAAREFLLRTCERILVLDTDELLFDGTLQRIVLVAAIRRQEGSTQKPLLAFEKVTSDDFSKIPLSKIFDLACFTEYDVSPEKWMDGLLSAEEREAFHLLSANDSVKNFSDIAKVQVGIVTGANSFFVVSKSIADKYSLYDYLRPIFGRSSHVHGLSYSETDHLRNLESDLPCLFLDLNGCSWKDLPLGVRSYLELGESQGLQMRYKTRIREPWWQVPSVYSTNIGLLKRAHEAPRLIFNELEALTTDTAYRITSTLQPTQLTLGWINSLTLLACELNGRTYGGGVLELVPSEIRKTPIPILRDTSAFEAVDWALHEGTSIRELLPKQNTLIASAIGVDREILDVMEKARNKMLNRRTRNVGK